MTLPIDMTGAVWFVSQAIWEWEDVPQTPADDAATPTQSPATGDAAQSDSTACEGANDEPAFTRELVFKGFTFDTRYNWIFNTDSPLAHPWEPDEDRSDDARQHAHPPVHPATDELAWPAEPAAELPATHDLPSTEDPSHDE
jgi:hypothetical protein